MTKIIACQLLYRYASRLVFAALAVSVGLWDHKRGMRKLVMLCEHKTALSTIRRIVEMTENDNLHSVLSQPDRILKGLSMDPSVGDYRKLRAPVSSRHAEDLQRRLHGMHGSR